MLPPLPREIDEDSIVSIANGVAVYAGITDPNERKPVFSALEYARTQAGAPKPGLSLWPPYPAGFFDYPQMVPGRYQNGAVWDWWGGMQVSGEFWTGYSELGRNHLNMVARDWARDARRGLRVAGDRVAEELSARPRTPGPPRRWPRRS